VEITPMSNHRPGWLAQVTPEVGGEAYVPPASTVEVTRAEVSATVSAQWRVTRNRPHLGTSTWPQVR